MTDGCNFCLNCGHNHDVDRIVFAGAWEIDPRGAVFYENRYVRLYRQHVDILHTLAAAQGRPVTRDILWSRVSHGEAAHTSDLSNALCALRRRLLDLGIPVPFRTVNLVGVIWILPKTSIGDNHNRSLVPRDVS